MAKLNLDHFFSRPFGRYRITIFVLCAMILFIDGFDSFLIGGMLPILAKAFDVSPQAMTYVLLAQGVGFAIGAYGVSAISDWYGRRKIILVCVASFGALTMAAATTSSLHTFGALRFVAFIFFGGAIPNVIALMAEYSSESQRERIVVILATFISLGSAVGIGAAPAIAAASGWQSVFLIGGAIALVLACGLYFLLPESVRFLVLRQKSVESIKQILRRVDPRYDLAEITTVLMDERNTGRTSAAGLFRENMALNTLLLWLTSIMSFGVVITLFATWMPTFLNLLANVEFSLAARMVAVAAIGGVLYPFVLALIMKRLGPNRALALSYLIGAVCLALLAVVDQMPGLVWIVVIGLGTFVVGGQTGLYAIASKIYPTEMRSTGIGWVQGAGRIISIGTPAIGGLIVAQSWSLASLAAVFVIPVLVSAVSVYLLRLPRATQANADMADAVLIKQ